MRNNRTPDKPFSLREEIKRRKLAEFDRDLEQRKQARAQGKTGPLSKTATTTSTIRPISPVVSATDQLNSAKAATTTSTIRPISPLPESRRPIGQTGSPESARTAEISFQNLTSRKKIMLVGIGTAILIALVLIGSLIIP